MNKKLLVGLSLIAFSASAVADEVEDEIQKLKKENELLELQKKNRDLKNNVKKADSPNALNGWFVGAELGIAPSVDNHLSVDSATDFSFGHSSKTAIPFNFIFGYQYYFTHNMGLHIKGLLGYANYDSNMTLSDSTDFKLKSYAIHYGIDLSYLYDFISSSKHTFGLNASIGYEFGYFSSSFVTPDETSSGTMETKLNSYNASSFSTSYGVHYFLNNTHQFWLTYKYRSSYPLNVGSKSVDDTTVKYSSKPKSAIMLSYAYKF